MDSLTQAVLGATVMEAVLGRKLGNRAVLWGLWFGTLPDLDVLAMPWMDPVSALEWHRGLSHGFLLWVLGALAGGWLLSRVHRARGVTFPAATLAVFLAWSTHVLIDVFTMYGTQVFEPFSNARVATNNLFIIDPLFTLPMLLTLLVFVWMRRDARPRRVVNGIGLGLACLYVAWSFTAKAMADRIFADAMPATGIRAERWMTSPMLANTFLWRALVWDGSAYWIAYTNVLKPARTTAWVRVEPGHDLLAAHAKDRAVAQLRWFSREYFAVREESGGNLRFIDLRMGEVSPATDGTDPGFVFNWILTPGPGRMTWRQVWGGRGSRARSIGLWEFLWKTS